MREVELVAHLRPAFTEVLETMFFTSVIDICATGAAAGPPPIISRLRFRGDPSGVFEIGMTGDAARRLAAAFLGEDEQELSESRTGEVVCELANMLCGSFLSRMGDFTFELSHPEIVPSNLEAAGTSMCFELPEGRVAVGVRFGELSQAHA
jgi:chemotaxis protein CheY-P-specific phosphatase CheC